MAGSRSSWSVPTTTAGSLTLRAGAIHAIKLNRLDPQAWLADVLARLPDHPAKRIDQLLPWWWLAPTEASAAA